MSYLVSRYKELLARGAECSKSIFVVKSGYVSVWCRVQRKTFIEHQLKLSRMREASEQRPRRLYISANCKRALLESGLYPLHCALNGSSLFDYVPVNAIIFIAR